MRSKYTKHEKQQTDTDHNKDDANRPERRTALVAKELSRYKVDIAALSETRFAEEGQLRELKAGYTFFWSGRGKDERRESGVGFAIKNDLIGKLTSLPKGVNDRLMTLTLQLKGKRYATIVSCYAPTMTNPDDIKDKFYEELDTIIASTPKQDKLVVLGDFNARVGRPQGKKPPKRLNIDKLNYVNVKQHVASELDEKLESLPLNSGNIEQDWADFKNTDRFDENNEAIDKLLEEQDWFDENNEAIDKLLEKKNRLLKLNLSNKTPANTAALHKVKQTVQTELRRMKDRWFIQKADEIQGYADTHNSKLYESEAGSHRPPPDSGAPLLYRFVLQTRTEPQGILKLTSVRFRSQCSCFVSSSFLRIFVHKRARVDKQSLTSVRFRSQCSCLISSNFSEALYSFRVLLVCFYRCDCKIGPIGSVAKAKNAKNYRL
ncbi:Hypothetical predicted protein, partial [Paramuricea clavata]